MLFLQHATCSGFYTGKISPAWALGSWWMRPVLSGRQSWEIFSFNKGSLSPLSFYEQGKGLWISFVWISDSFIFRDSLPSGFSGFVNVARGYSDIAGDTISRWIPLENHFNPSQWCNHDADRLHDCLRLRHRDAWASQLRATEVDVGFGGSRLYWDDRRVHLRHRHWQESRSQENRKKKSQKSWADPISVQKSYVFGVALMKTFQKVFFLPKQIEWLNGPFRVC